MGIGRTEDVTFSPDNRRLAIAGFVTNRIVVLDVEIDTCPTREPHVTITGLTELRSDTLVEPHGVAFIDDDTIVVANRGGTAPVFRLPVPAAGLREIEVGPVHTIGVHGADEVESPGSVAVVPVIAGLVEVLVCNNYVHHVTRHLLDSRTHRVLDGEVLLAAGLEIPDGIAVSNDRLWLAVSNHNAHAVFIFENVPHLDRNTPAVGVLRNVNYPHGLRFTPDDEHVLVADAGAPYVHAFARGADGWRGTRNPLATLRVMDDDTHMRGRHNPQEGGPKGLDIDRTGRVVVVSSEEMPLAFFDLAAFLGERPAPADSSQSFDMVAAQQEMTRSVVLREVGRSAALAAQVTELERIVGEREQEVRDLHEFIAAKSAVVAEQAAGLEHAQVELRALHAEYATLWAARSACAAELAATVDRLGYAHRVIDDRDAQLETITRSRSWRVTAPIRWTSGVARRLSARRDRGHEAP